MSVGGVGGNLSQKIWIEMQAIGGEVADDVVRQQRAIEDQARAMMVAFQDNVITGDVLVKLLAQLGKTYDTLTKQTQDFINAKNREKQAEQELAAVRAALGARQATQQKEIHDERVRQWTVEQAKLATVAAEEAALWKQLYAEQAQALKDLDAIRTKLYVQENADAKAVHDEKVRLWQEEQAHIAMAIAQETDLAAVRAGLSTKENAAAMAAHQEKVRIWQEEQTQIAAELAAEADMKAVRAALQQQDVTNTQAAHDQKVRLWQEETTAQEVAYQKWLQINASGITAAQNRVAIETQQRDALKNTIDVWAQGFTQVNKLADAQANYDRALKHVGQAETEAVASQKALTAAQQVYQQSGVGNVQALTNLKDARERVTRAEVASETAVGTLTAAQRRLNDETAKANTVIMASGTAADNATPKHSNLSRAIFITSQGVQDLEYGFRSVVNNVPQAVMEWTRVFGGSIEKAYAWGAGLGIAATAVSVFSNQITALWKSFTTSDAEKALGLVDTLKTNLESLKSSSWYIRIDTKEIEAAEEKYKRAKRAKDAFEAASMAQTEEQAEAGKRVIHAVVESAGGTDQVSGTKNIVDTMEKFRDAHPEMFKDNPLVKKMDTLREEIEAAKEVAENQFATPEARAGATEMMGYAEGKIDNLRKKLRDSYAQRIGEAMRGVDAEAGWIEQWLDADRDFFRKAGIGDQFRTELAAARRGQVRSDLAAGNQDPLWKQKQTAAREEARQKVDQAKKEAAEAKKVAADKTKADAKTAREAKAKTTKLGRAQDRVRTLVQRGTIQGFKNTFKTKFGETMDFIIKNRKELEKTAKGDVAEDAKTAAQFGKGLGPDIQAFLINQKLLNAQKRQLSQTPVGRRQIKQYEREEKTRQAQVRANIRDRNRDPFFRQKMRGASAQDKAMLEFQDQMALQGGMPMNRDSQRNFLDQMLASVLAASGAPGANEGDRAFGLAGKIVGTADKQVNAMVADQMLNQGNTMEALTATQGMILGRLQQAENSLRRVQTGQGNLRRNAQDNRPGPLPPASE